MPTAIETRALRKIYPAPPARKRGGARTSTFAPRTAAPPQGVRAEGGGIAALDGLDLSVEDGEFFGLLGPNGAGKTTTIGILTTRVRATSGEAFVAGKNVRTEDVAVRRRIGIVPQIPNPDRSLKGIENLNFHGAYFGIPTREAERRAMELLEQFDIGDKAQSKVDELSGGQQQRLMIARALLHEPQVLFLDEPTVGLDPQARLALWDVLRRLHREGRTIVMTTHYMQEADELCNRLAIVDQGRLLACDSPTKLKALAPGDTRIDLTIDGDAEAAAASCRTLDGVTRVDVAAPDILAYAARGGELIPALIRAVEQSGARVQNINLAKPSLESLFVSLTGRKLG
jgi:ABC-2 type transport system ATP-binding protein